MTEASYCASAHCGDPTCDRLGTGRSRCNCSAEAPCGFHRPGGSGPKDTWRPDGLALRPVVNAAPTPCTVEERKQLVFRERVEAMVKELGDLLIAKNEAYGDSALNPVRIFSKADTDEQLLVRLDDKLSRIKRGDADAFGEDVLDDLIGYLLLLRLHRRGGK